MQRTKASHCTNQRRPLIENGILILTVSGKSLPNKVAGSIAHAIRERGVVKTRTVGAGALNQAVKAVATARSYVAGEYKDLICTIGMTEITIDGQPRTAIELTIEPRL